MNERGIIGLPAPDDATALGAADAATLDQIFRRHARRQGEAIALADPPDRAAFTDGPPRRLTYAQTDRAVTALAHRLQALGLPPGAIVALQLPNTAEAIVALLGVLRAGLVAAPIPLLWRQTEARAALGEVGARALITCGRVAGVDHAGIALRIAAATFGIRLVCGFGTDLPDGVAGLDGIFAVGEFPEPHELPGRNRPDQLAVVTFDAARDGPMPLARTHTELLVGGLAAVLEARLEPRAAILATVLTSSFAALATAVVPWLLTAGTLALHQPFDPAVLAGQCAPGHFDAVVLPGPMVAPLAEAGLIGQSGGPRGILALWRSPERQAHSPVWRNHAALIDVLAFGEIGLVAMRRGPDGQPRPLRAGPVTAPSGTHGTPVVLAVARTPAGTLALGGPIVPRHGAAATTWRSPSADNAGFIDTGYACRIDSETNALTLTGAPPGLISVGGYRFALGELQDVVGRIDADGVLAALPDMLAGQKLAGSAADQAAMRDALAALGINPLVGAAFRAPRRRRAPAA